MPNRDGKGPNGKGPKTGRQEGNCDNAKPIARGNGYRRRGQGQRDGRRNN